MRILVTGGAGFIGSFLVDRLVSMGHTVKVLDNLTPQVHAGGEAPSYVNQGAEYQWGDVRDADALTQALHAVDVVFHQAAVVGVAQSQYEIRRYVEHNTGGTANLLDLLVNTDHEVRKLIVAGSMSSYGEGAYRCEACGDVSVSIRADTRLAQGRWEHECPRCGRDVQSVPTPETKPLESTSIYAITKKDQEEMSLTVGKAYGLPTVVLRYFNVYGPRQSLSNPYTGVAAIFLSRIRNGSTPVIYEDGAQSRDFISVHDVVQANILAMERSEADYGVYNVGTGTPRSISFVASTLIESLGADVEPEVVGQFRKGDIRHCFADIGRIRSDLGFEPSLSFEDGMRELMEWSDSASANDGFRGASEELKKRGLLV